MPYAPQSQGPWLKGLVASNQPLAQPKGSFPRGSNLVLMERGALTPCDGSGIINWFNGAVQNNRGRFMSEFLFEPTGVNPYYLVLAQALDEPLGAPANLLTVDAGAGGTLAAGTYRYEVTALDGVGGETTVSNESIALTILANHKITLTWNVVPNAFGYNVYRTTGGSGTEVLLFSSKLPVLQPNPLTATVTFTDDGTTSTGGSYSASCTGYLITGHHEVIFTTTTPIVGTPSPTFVATGFTPAGFNQTYTFQFFESDSNVFLAFGPVGTPTGAGVGGTITFTGATGPPLADTTQQVVLFQMPVGNIPITYNDSNIVAFFPATVTSLGQVPTGGSGGSGTTGPGIKGRGSSTPSGGIIGLVSAIPQFKQFTNRAIIALGNGFAVQVFWDNTGTTVNKAPTGAVSSVSKTADVVTVTSAIPLSATDPTSPGFMPVGSNVILSNMTDPTYDGTFVVISVSSPTFKIRIPTASGGPSTGTWTVATTPITDADNTFFPQFPKWAATTAVAVGDIYEPTTQPGASNIYITCIQTGVTGSVEPTWPTVAATGQQFPHGNTRDGSALWQESGYLAAPAPPGAGHIEIYSGSLWVFNTFPVDSSNGLEGPTAIRMSNVNNIFAWNPVNQAFLDKDDGAEGMGLGKFTITALGIPPEGSLIAFKYRVPYQIIGVFGANNFAIQPVSSDMGCLAPRTIIFVSGYGLARYSHLGYSVFDGYRDQVISEQIRPYLFPVNDFDSADITVADANYIPLSWAAQTANPPMYAIAIPIGNSGGKLTRIMLYDLILKCWAAPVDLPFPIGSMVQVQPVTSNPLAILGGFNDGALQRWQAGDVLWYTGGGVSQLEVAWSVRSTTMASQNSSQRIWARKLMIRGTGSNVDTDPAMVINVQIRSSGIVQSSINYSASNLGDFDIDAAIGLTGLRFDAILSGDDHLELDGWDWAIEPRPFGVPVGIV